MRTKLSVPVLAREWGVSKDKIYALIRQGELRAINIATVRGMRPRYLIDRGDIERFERSREARPTAAPARMGGAASGKEVKHYF